MPTNTASPTFDRAVELILDQSEAAARAFIRAMPDGVYRTETYLDNDRSGGEEPVPIKVKVIVAGDELTVDYTDMAEQSKGPINSGYFGGGQTIARVAFKYLMGADEMANEGTFRPIKLILPQGKLSERRSERADVHVSDAVPDRDRRHHQGAGERAARSACPAAHFGTHSGVRFYGRRAQRLVLRHPRFAATAAGAPAPPMTAPDRSAPWRMATPASSRSNCRNR